jgi:hypothetical protein
MQATIKYYLTHEAQRARMAATGQPVSRKQEAQVDITANDLELLKDYVASDGSITIDIESGYSRLSRALIASGRWEEGGMNKRPEATQFVPSFLFDVRFGLQNLEKAKAKEEAVAHDNGEYNKRIVALAYEKFLADPAARFPRYSSERGVEQRSPADWHASEHKAFTAEVERRNEADIEAKKAADEAKERAKQQCIAEFIAAHGDAIGEQFADGLLSRQEALTMLAESVFDELGIPEAAKWDNNYCEDSDCACGEKDLNALPQSVYPAWKAIKDKLSGVEGWKVAFRCIREHHEGEYNDDGETRSAGPAFYIASVIVPHGPFQFERAVKLEKQ